MILYIECNMGAAGDMLMASLLELHDAPDEFLKEINNIGIDGVEVKKSNVSKCGIKGSFVSVLIGGHEEDEHHHHHTSITDISGIIDSLNVPETVKNHCKSVYRLIAEAESKSHGVPVDLVHFHEVGALDAVVDIAGVCMLIEYLKPEKIVVSPINTGSGQVHTSHGILPVPAPATASILQNAPVYQNDINGELCTPTGAALLMHFADEFGGMPLMNIKKTGYGMGKKDFAAANCLRSFMGEASEKEGANQTVDELTCNIDDMTPEALGYACSVLFENGALDVFTTSVHMKKNRHAVMLTCLCKPNDADFMAKLMLKHTSTNGIRKKQCERYTLETSYSKMSTKYGNITVKTASGYGIVKSKPEYDDVARLSKEKGVSFTEVYNEAVKNL